MKRQGIQRWIFPIIIIIIVAVFLKKNFALPREIVPRFSIPLETNVDELGLMDNDNIVTWDGDLLMYYNKHGEFIESQDHTSEGLEVFFGKEKVYLFDETLKKVYIYSNSGKEEPAFFVPGEVFNITSQHGNVIVHIKQGRGESLYLLEGGGGLKPIFETEHFILDYDVLSKHKFAVSELSSQASGYKTTVFYKEHEMLKEEFQSEVSMDLAYIEDNLYMVTEKKLYKFNPEELKFVDIPLISDVQMDKSGIHLLHSGVYSKYNLKLEEVHKEVVPGNVNRLDRLFKDKVYGSGQTDIVGNLGLENEFYIRLPLRAEHLILQEDQVILFGEDQLQAYDLKLTLPFREDEIQEPQFETE